MSNQTAAAVAALVNSINWQRQELDLQRIIDACNKGKVGKPLTDWLVAEGWNNHAKEVQLESGPALLELVGTVTIPATTGELIAKEKFVRDTSCKAKVKISHLSNNFILWFLSGDGKIEDPISEQTLRYHKSRQSLVDGPIIAELGGAEKSETTLSEMFSLMERQKNGESGPLLNNGHANIFYIRDQKGVLRAVVVNWYDDGWDVSADSVESPDRWNGGYQVFSRNSDLKSSEPSALVQA